MKSRVQKMSSIKSSSSGDQIFQKKKKRLLNARLWYSAELKKGAKSNRNRTVIVPILELINVGFKIQLPIYLLLYNKLLCFNVFSGMPYYCFDCETSLMEGLGVD